MALAFSPNIILDEPPIDGAPLPVDYAIREARTSSNVASDLRRASGLVVEFLAHGSQLRNAEWAYIAEVLTSYMEVRRFTVIVGHSDGLTESSVNHGVATQLWNLLVADLPVKTCANDKCWNYFTRQRDVAGSRASSLARYCCFACGNQQRVRRSRRKQREVIAAARTA